MSLPGASPDIDTPATFILSITQQVFCLVFSAPSVYKIKY